MPRRRPGMAALGILSLAVRVRAHPPPPALKGVHGVSCRSVRLRCQPGERALAGDRHDDGTGLRIGPHTWRGGGRRIVLGGHPRRGIRDPSLVPEAASPAATAGVGDSRPIPVTGAAPVTPGDAGSPSDGSATLTVEGGESPKAADDTKAYRIVKTRQSANSFDAAVVVDGCDIPAPHTDGRQ